mmetsp:Transcript_31094/g.87586  ORF Transcript_31094/g.87586 Transcript_31094/m.87586 type:complete len:285 (+) Transcript_31094:950-1804(+)
MPEQAAQGVESIGHMLVQEVRLPYRQHHRVQEQSSRDQQQHVVVPARDAALPEGDHPEDAERELRHPREQAGAPGCPGFCGLLAPRREAGRPVDQLGVLLLPQALHPGHGLGVPHLLVAGHAAHRPRAAAPALGVPGALLVAPVLAPLAALVAAAGVDLGERRVEAGRRGVGLLLAPRPPDRYLLQLRDGARRRHAARPVGLLPRRGRRAAARLVDADVGRVLREAVRLEQLVRVEGVEHAHVQAVDGPRLHLGAGVVAADIGDPLLDVALVRRLRRRPDLALS